MWVRKEKLLGDSFSFSIYYYDPTRHLKHKNYFVIISGPIISVGNQVEIQGT